MNENCSIINYILFPSNILIKQWNFNTYFIVKNNVNISTIAATLSVTNGMTSHLFVLLVKHIAKHNVSKSYSKNSNVLDHNELNGTNLLSNLLC